MLLNDPLAGWLSDHRDDLVKYLQDLVRIPSDNPPGDCAAIASRVEQEFRSFGLEIERHDVPREEGPPAPNVLGWLGRPTKNPVIVLNAHVDVVPPGEGWTVDPYGGAIIDGKVLGRGAAVSKSDVATYTYALAALGATSDTPAGMAVVAAITADEETGGAHGPGWLLSQYGMRPRFAICAGFTHGVVVALNGCLQGNIVIEGKTAHAAMPWNGSDAIRLAQAVLSRLYEVDSEFFKTSTSRVKGIVRPTLVPTSIQGGGPQGVVAGSVLIRIDQRIPPGESVDEALEAMHNLVNDVSATYGGAPIRFEPTVLVNPLVPSARQDELVNALCREAPPIVGHELELQGLPIFTDARWFAEFDVPVVLYGAGPPDTITGARGHAADENVRIQDLVAATEVVARAVRRLLKRSSSGQS